MGLNLHFGGRKQIRYREESVYTEVGTIYRFPVGSFIRFVLS